MSYQVLARKYRPQAFDEVIGQDHVTTTWKNAILQNRLHHAYLLTGARGIGKTSLARIFAKSLNCEKGPTPNPCNQCSNCLAITKGNFLDVQEIDGASNTSVESVRELREQVKYMPAAGKYKIYIIDEVHMLSNAAFNALLKTLEEPPANSSVILITARPDSLLPTIRSRSQRLTFAPLSISEMETYLAANYRRPPEDTALLARVCEGRIGQAMAIDLSEYRRERRELIELLELLASGEDRYRLLKAAEYFGKQERDAFERKFDLLARLLRDLILLEAGRPVADIVNIDEAQRLTGLSSQTGGRRLMEWVEKFRDLRANLVININRQIAMEAVLLGMEME